MGAENPDSSSDAVLAPDPSPDLTGPPWHGSVGHRLSYGLGESADGKREVVSHLGDVFSSFFVGYMSPCRSTGHSPPRPGQGALLELVPLG